MKDILVIVGNASRARLYRVHAGVLERVEVLDHPESRARRRELVSDRPGRFRDETGGGGPHRSGMEPPTDAHEVEVLSFARTVARRIAIHARRAHLPDLLLLAPPRFLGRLKAALEPTVAGHVVATVSHDYTAAAEADLVDILEGLGIRAALPSPA